MTEFPSEEDLYFGDPNFVDFDRSSDPEVFASPLDAQSEWISQTPSINPPRPRTHAAGYDPSEMTLTIVFRDGTWWNYYNVPPEVWDAFKAAPSPGRFLRDHVIDGSLTLDTWNDMGPVSFGQLTPQLKTFVKKQGLGGTWQRYKSVYNKRR